MANCCGKSPRDDGLYVGCVHNDAVVVVGRNGLRALKLSDGQSAWDEPTLPLPAGSTPSGRGFFNGERYHLPLSSAEVAAIDVRSGRIVSRSKSRSGTVPGNLICYRGAVISQNIDMIERFDQRDDLWQQIVAAIAADPNDAGALARRGELLLDEGNFRDATENLRKSFALVPDPHTRELLVDALLEGLRIDFADHRGELAEIERLIDKQPQQSTFLRLVATGCQATGDLPAAFAAYLRIADLESPNELDRIDNSLSVRRDRWVQSRLKSLLDAASLPERTEMERTVAARLEAAMQNAGPVSLKRFLAYFGALPIADTAREQLVTRLVEEGSLVEAEQLLRRLEASNDVRRAAAATARYAALLENAGRSDEAVLYYRRLAERFADVECRSGQTGKEIVASLSEKPEIQALLHPVEAFPVGIVERDEAKGQAGIVSRHVALELQGNLGPFYEFMSVSLDQQQQAIVGLDGLGRERWRVSLRDLNQPNNNNNFLGNGLSNPARVSGHIVLVSLGRKSWRSIPSVLRRDGTRVLWRHELGERAGNGAVMAFQPQQHVIQLPWAGPRLVVADQLGRPIGNIGPMTPELACYQRMRSVVAVDPLTGETIWSRNDVEPGSDIFGDDEMLFIVAPNSEEALVVRHG